MQTEALRCALRGRAVSAVRELARLGRFRREVEAARRAGGVLDPSWGAGIPDRLEREKLLLIPAIGKIGPAPGVAGLLRALRPRVRSLVAISDFDAEARLVALGLDGAFDQLYAAEYAGALKPCPAVFERVLDELDIPPAALLHIGNRPDADAAGARAAGCRSLILGEDFDSFAELRTTLVEVTSTDADRTAGT